MGHGWRSWVALVSTVGAIALFGSFAAAAPPAQRAASGATKVKAKAGGRAPTRQGKARSSGEARAPQALGAESLRRRQLGGPASGRSVHAATKGRSGAAVSIGRDEAPPPAPDDPDRERIVRLQETIASIVHGPVLGRLRVGMHVTEAHSGRTLYRSRAVALMDPASNQKILATTAALMRLGPDWRFRTELVGAAPDFDGVIHGDVILRGSSDPSLRATDLEAMAFALAERGVTRIEGAVLADPHRIGADETAPNERSPLRVGHSAVVVRVRPGERPGAPAVVTMKPLSDTFVLQNGAKTGRPSRRRGRVGVSLSATSGGQIVVRVSGAIAANQPGVVIRRVPPNQRLYAAALLRGALVEHGVVVRGSAGLGTGAPRPGATLQLLALHESDPLSVIARRINKDSDNEYADRLLEVVGAELHGGAATPAKGIRALREAMTELGLSPNSYVPTNGSGLGHANRVTADAIADLLRKLYYDPRVGPEILQSLSVGGVDGTTRNRFRGSPAAERVRAKTGTLNGKSALSGYVGDGDDIIVFAIMVEGLRPRRLSAVRAAQVSAVNAMMRYARGAEGEPAADEVEPPRDFEVGDDVTETEEEEPASPTPQAPPGGTAQTPPTPSPPIPPSQPPGSPAKAPTAPTRSVTSSTTLPHPTSSPK